MGFFDRIRGKKDTELSKIGALIEQEMQDENQRAQKARGQIEQERSKLDQIMQLISHKERRWDDFLQLTRKELEALQHLKVLLKALDSARTSLQHLDASMASLKEASSAQQAQAQLLGRSAVKAINQQMADTRGIAQQISQHLRSAFDDIAHIMDEQRVSDQDVKVVKEASSNVLKAAEALSKLAAEEQKTAEDLTYVDRNIDSQLTLLRQGLQEIQQMADNIGK